MALAQAYTIGFTQKSATTFFQTLKRYGIKRLLDVRINNTSQLAGFTKRDDLQFFLKELCGAEYRHEPLLAPTQTLLKCYRQGEIPWAVYVADFLRLMDEREVQRVLEPELFETPTVLLCSEATPERCHRRLVVEYLKDSWGELDIVHL